MSQNFSIEKCRRSSAFFNVRGCRRSDRSNLGKRLRPRKHHSTKVIETVQAPRECSGIRKTLQTAAALRDLWLGHIFWVRNVSVATIDKNIWRSRPLSSKRSQTRKRSRRRLNRFMAQPQKIVF